MLSASFTNYLGIQAGAMMAMQASTSQAFPAAAVSLLRVPAKGDRRSIPPFKGAAESPSQLSGVLEVASIQRPVAQDVPPSFNQVQPGGSSGQEMKVESRMAKVPQQGVHTAMNGEVVDD